MENIALDMATKLLLECNKSAVDLPNSKIVGCGSFINGSIFYPILRITLFYHTSQYVRASVIIDRLFLMHGLTLMWLHLFLILVVEINNAAHKTNPHM